MADALLTVRDLRVRFGGTRDVTALDGVSFDVAPGEALALLGESGSGKSVTLRTLLRLHPSRTTRIEGQVHFEGRDVLAFDAPTLRRYRGGAVSMVFQEPGLALDPVHTIGDQIVEAIRAHERVDRATARRRTFDVLEQVRIPQAKRRMDAYPHELSGGTRQRAMIALALACNPKLLLADEPTTALDASVQMQILLLLRELQRERGLAVIFVTHDIGAAIEIADRVAVMYAGRIVETGDLAQVVGEARHPYTAGLLASTVDGAARGQPLRAIRGAPPDLAALPAGCAFAERCDHGDARCRTTVPEWHGDAGRGVACWHPLERAPAA